MPTSATGNPATSRTPVLLCSRRRADAGFTLLELMVVVAITGLASAAVALALRDSAQSELDREAQALVAVLEAARAESRASGVALTWRARPEGFELSDGGTVRAQRWARPELAARSEAPVLLGPEPVIGPQTVRLWNRSAPENSRWISTDGLRAFEVRSSAAAPH